MNYILAATVVLCSISVYYFLNLANTKPIPPPTPNMTIQPLVEGAAAKKLYPALFICHGGGPMPLLDDPDHRPMMAMWKKHVADIIAAHGRPAAIAVVSAHYQAQSMRAGGDANPGMYYDYGGFPPETYKLQYPAPGNPTLAAEMIDAIKSAGIEASVDPTKRYDHGVFVPLLGMFPDADIPVIPLSVLRDEDPLKHFKIGQALRPFREKGVFFLGSGSSMHHFGYFMKPGAGVPFNNALTSAICDPKKTQEERVAAMCKFREFEGFSEAHPAHETEHLMPIFTIAGTADGTVAEEVADIPFMKANARHYMFSN